jgi:hypothetical protein
MVDVTWAIPRTVDVRHGLKNVDTQERGAARLPLACRSPAGRLRVVDRWPLDVFRARCRLLAVDPDLSVLEPPVRGLRRRRDGRHEQLHNVLS